MEEIVEQPTEARKLDAGEALIALMLKLPDEKSDIEDINFDAITEFCKEIESVTTTKRLSLIPGIELKFNNCFIYLQRWHDFNKSYSDILRIIKDISSDVEFDYFAENIKDLSVEELFNESGNNQES